jgi:hypothetical protein
MANKIFDKVKETIFSKPSKLKDRRSGEDRRKRDKPPQKGANKRKGTDRRGSSDYKQTIYNDFSQTQTIQIGEILSQLENKLKFTGPHEVLQSAIHCNQGYACQKTDWEPCGQVLKEIPGGFLEMDSNNFQRRPCKYHTYFGSDHLCACPVHTEIFRRYGNQLPL